MKFVSLIAILLPAFSYGYTINRGDYGEELHWSQSSQNVFLNSSNSSSISETVLSNILNSTTENYSSNGFLFNKYLTSSAPTERRNDIYFSNNSGVFNGTSVLAITKISYDGETIIESDIILNDSITFSSIDGSGTYIGDVLNHELGHFVGLGHSQVHGSTMFYSLNKGQSTLHDDDTSGVKHLYSSGYTEITGNVVGGNSIGVFGAHVQAISAEDGEVKSATVSETDGSFVISGLSSEETYYIYVEPLDSLSNMPSHYLTAKKNFCLSGSNYRGTFYQSCRRSEEGKPQGVSGSGVISVGNISIGCDLSVPVSYMQNKPSNTNNLNIVDALGNAGETVVGYFSDLEASTSIPDEYEIDLQNFAVPAGDIYLDIKLVSQKIYSPVRLELSSMSETLEFENLPDAYGLYYDADGNPDLDLTARIKLNSTPSINIFKFSVTPQRLSDYIIAKPFTMDSFLPDSAAYKDDTNFYMMILTISKKESGTYNVISQKKYSIQDNSSCVDGPLTYSVSGGSQSKSSALSELEKRKKQKDPEILSCGTVGGPDGPSSGSKSFMLAFVLGAVSMLSIKHVRI